MLSKHRTWTKEEEMIVGDYIRANGYVSESKKIFYIATPKVACTSLKWWFASLEGFSRFMEDFSESYETDPDLVIHDGFMKVAPGVTGLSLSEAKNSLFSKDFFRFAVVRNPYRRIFSAWQSKILLQEPLYLRNYSRHDFFNQPVDSTEELVKSYESFLEYLLESQEHLHADYHWTPQFNLLRPDLIDYSVIAQIENSACLVEELSKRLGPDVPSPFDGHRANESIIPYSSSFLSEKSVEIIKRLYSVDFSYFNYDPEPPSARQPQFESLPDIVFKAIHMIRGRHRRFSKIIEGRVKAESFARELEVQIEQKNSYLSQSYDEIHRLEELVIKKDSAIGEQAYEINHRSDEIHRLEELVAKKDSVISDQATEINRLGVVIVEKESVIVTNHDSRIKEKDYLCSEINKRDIELGDLYTSYDKFRAETKILQRELATIKASRFYRLALIWRDKPFSINKLLLICRVILGGLLPASFLNPLRRLFRLAQNSTTIETVSGSGAYILKAPPKVSVDRPVVVHVIANFMTGGSSRLVVDIIEHLSVEYQHFVLTSFNPTPPAYVGIEIEELRFPNDSTPFIEYYRRISPDFLHVHYWGDCDEPWYAKAIGAAEILGIKVIENINTPIAPFRSDSVLKYVYVSDYVRKVFGDGLASEVTIYPGSDFQLFHREPSDHAPADCVGMVYRLEHDKLNENSIQPFIKIAQIRPATKILIVGGGSLLETFRTLVIEAGVYDNFEFTDYVSYDKLPSLYRRMSVFIAPVWKESFGQVSPFAMSMKIPVVGYNIGAISEIIGTSELVASPSDSEALAKIAIRLLDSEDERRVIGEFQQKRALENFSVRAMIGKYSDAYSEVLAMNCKERA